MVLGVSDAAGKYYVPPLGAFLIYLVMVGLLVLAAGRPGIVWKALIPLSVALGDFIPIVSYGLKRARGSAGRPAETTTHTCLSRPGPACPHWRQDKASDEYDVSTSRHGRTHGDNPATWATRVR